ncbi:MAG: choice-of-anchor D domain-containing protein [Wenzhouxiangellaceae bacterium]|nr:MAG: choice-of-anchor D domain-containing protein [Wenzhouxiangellaceae bacterium]
MRQIARTFLLLAGVLLVQHPAISSPDPIVFENRAPGPYQVWTSYGSDFRVQNFRMHERTHITALGIGNLMPNSEGAGQTLFAAIYRIDTPHSVPEVIGDGELLATTLIQIPDEMANVSGELSLVVEPGWYAIVTGRGRHGASAQSGHGRIGDNGTTAHPDAWWSTYTLNPTTGERTWMGITLRYFIKGQTLPPAAAPSRQFRVESARPQARWTQSANPINNSVWYGTRFEVTRQSRIDRAGTWLYNGSGELFAAIIRLSGPEDLPLPTNHPNFMNSVVGLTLMPVDVPHNTYWARFEDLLLEPGHYALAFGSNRFGASGSANSMTLADNVLLPGGLIWLSSSGDWLWSTGSDRMFILEGLKPDIVVTPNPVDFGTLDVGESATQGMLVTNWNEDEDVRILQVELDAPDFALGDDLIECEDMILGSGQDCVFSVMYQPSSGGEHSAMLRISTDGEPGLVEINLTGTGAQPALEFLQETIDFDEVWTDAGGKTLSATLTNNGSGAAVDLEPNLAGSPAFSISGGNCGTSLAAGSSCQLDIQFLPSGTGPLTATLLVDEQQGTIPAQLNLSGAGREPFLQLSPENLDFGHVVVGSQRQLAVEISYQGGAVAEILEAGLGTGSSGYSIDSSSCLPGTLLEAGQACTMEVVFVPEAEGLYPGMVIIDAGEPLQASLPLGAQGVGDRLFRDRFEMR